jgi:hypothetical protein
MDSWNSLFQKLWFSGVMSTTLGFSVYLHVLVVAGGSILLVSGDVEFMAGFDRNVLVADGVSGTNFRSFLMRESELNGVGKHRMS